MSHSPKIFFFLGGPGVGKGTICTRLVQEFGYTHFCAGELLRDVVKKGDSELGKKIASILEKGAIVPSEITVELLRTHISLQPNPHGYLIDGFPRNLEQAGMFEDGIAKAKGIIFFECPTEIMKERLLSRIASGSTRSDDTLEIIVNRLKVNMDVCQPVVEHYRATGRCLEVDASKTVEDVYQQVVRILHTLGESPLLERKKVGGTEGEG